MSLQFIMGPSGSGKSHYLYQWVTSEAATHPEKKYIVLVPEQFTMQTQKDLVMASPHKGILNIEVLSFNRLAHRVFEETGENGRMILSDVGKNFVIRKVAGDNQDKLKVLGGNLKKMGYVNEMKSVISEFTQYDIAPNALDEMVENAKQHPNLYYKLKDIQVVYEAFQEFLSGKYITSDEVLDVLSMVTGKSKLLKGSVIVLDGFTGFTPIQNKLLRELLPVCEKMMVTVTMDKRENPFVYQHPYQLFALSKQMVTGLVKIAKEVGKEVEEPIYLYDKPIYRFRENESMAFLESHLFRYSKERYQKEQSALQIWCARNPKEEIDFVAQRIRHLVRTEGYRYRDIAVLAGDVNAYSNHIEQVFAKYDLPIFMDHKRSILLNSCVEYIRSLLNMAEQNFTYESVFRYLRTGFSNISQKDADVLENYVLALGIRGYKKWQEKWVRRTRGMEEAELADVNRIREEFVASIEEVMLVLKSRSKTVYDVTKALHTFFMKEELQQRVKEYQVKFETEGELALEKEYAQVYRIVIELLDQFVELLGDERISMQEYAELLDAGLEEAKVGIIPPSIDQIVVGDIERSRMKDVKVVFLIGVNDIYIPGVSGKNGLLSEYDRQHLVENGAVLAPNAKEQTYIQKFYLYLTLTKPSNQVYLTYSKTSGDGKAIRPAYLISDLLKLFTELKVQEVSQSIRDKELTVEGGIDAVIRGLQGKEKGLESEWQELYTWYKKHPEWCQKIEQLVEAAFFSSEERRLSQETAKALYGELLKGSVTRLEKFSACAYAHFLNYGLRLREREMYQFQAVDMGNLFHGAIERFAKKLEQVGYAWTDVPEEMRETFVQDSVDESIVDYGNSILYSSARNEYTILRLKRMLRRTVWALTKQLEKGDFVPVGYEVVFDGGKIDRIDVCEDEDKLYVKVIDYKTGEKSFDLGELCYGLQMQLVVYMNAALDIQKNKHPEKVVIPAGLLYYRMKDPIVDKPASGKEAEDVILQELRPDGVVQGSEEVLEHLDRGFAGTSQVIPVARTQAGGLSKTSKVLSEKEFHVISEYAKKQSQDVRREILGGNVDLKPYALGGSTACDYCPYHSVCGFDERIDGHEYRRLEKLDSDKALEKMRGEVDAWE